MYDINMIYVISILYLFYFMGEYITYVFHKYT